ncbi:unnamed protein product [Paramecium sonneborni]|uniref:Uncharacterized protein n=1 Tax=Paramecium sonneborni TaxID=65129 RepID=A0A8S1NJ72_9CILI|nr:unnamed protein product [Paramecium sonneborni]
MQQFFFQIKMLIEVEQCKEDEILKCKHELRFLKNQSSYFLKQMEANNEFDETQQLRSIIKNKIQDQSMLLKIDLDKKIKIQNLITFILSETGFMDRYIFVNCRRDGQRTNENSGLLLRKSQLQKNPYLDIIIREFISQNYKYQCYGLNVKKDMPIMSETFNRNNKYVKTINSLGKILNLYHLKLIQNSFTMKRQRFKIVKSQSI